MLAQNTNSGVTHNGKPQHIHQTQALFCWILLLGNVALLLTNTEMTPSGVLDILAQFHLPTKCLTLLKVLHRPKGTGCGD
ncbi:hypothetical protein scyTo_0002377 [Scyliorhinus torazame]|uniref:Uncharacterized protein n=1 Tax=Scyliorhinus torazame TaxID=75743 RepID=A0A401PJ75_SCYTO|nr:hypothetical protein [Scyliorhinus torazame]